MGRAGFEPASVALQTTAITRLANDPKRSDVSRSELLAIRPAVCCPVAVPGSDAHRDRTDQSQGENLTTAQQKARRK